MTQRDPSDPNPSGSPNPFGDQPHPAQQPHPTHPNSGQVNYPPGFATNQPAKNQSAANQSAANQPAAGQPLANQSVPNPSQPPGQAPHQRLPQQQYSAGGGVYTDHTGADIRPASAGAKTAIIVAITVVTVVGFCGGGMGLLVYSFTKQSVTTEDFKTNRMAAGAPPSAEITANLSDPAPFEVSKAVKNPLSESESEELRTFIDKLIEVANLEAEDDLIDMHRLVVEIENTGLSAGVNGWTRAIWKSNLEGAQNLPWLSPDLTEIIGFEWLRPDVDARVTLATFWDSDENPQIWYFYLTRRSDQWKVYDWRKVMSACSEAQYWAVYTKANEPLDVAYADMAQEIDDIYNSDLPYEAKGKQMYATYMRYTYPPVHRGLAQEFLAEYLVLLESMQELEQLVAQMNPQQMLNGHYYAGLVALHKDRKRRAFDRAESIMQSLPWHPSAAILAAKAASTAQEKQQAANWLMATLKLTLKHDLSSAHFFSLATPEQQQELLADWAAKPDANAHVVEMFDELKYSDVIPDRESIAAALEQIPELADAALYAKLSLASGESDSEKVLQLGLELLGREGGQELLDGMSYDWVRQRILSSALEDGQVELLMQIQPDLEKQIELIASTTRAYSYLKYDWQSLNDYLEQLDASELSPQASANLAAVQGSCLLELDEPADAFELLLPLVEAADLVAEEPEQHVRNVFGSALRAAADSKQYSRFVGAFPEGPALLPALAQYLEDGQGYDRLSEFLQWQASEYPDSDSPWLNYYRGRVCYAQGDWRQADKYYQSVASAVDAAGDEGLDHSDIPPLFFEYYDQYALDSMSWERLEAAIRTGHASQLVENLIAEGKMNDEWLEDMGYYRDEFEASDDAARVADILIEFSDPGANALGYRMRASVLQARGAIDQAFDAMFTAAKRFRDKQNLASEEWKDDFKAGVEDLLSEMVDTQAMDPTLGEPAEELAEENMYFFEAANMACTYRRPAFLRRLRPLANTTSERLQLDAIRALLNEAAPQLIQSLKAADEAAEYGDNFTTNTHVVMAAKDSKIWPEVTQSQPIDFSYFQYGIPAVEGVLFLSQPASRSETEIVQSLADSTKQFIEELSKASANNASDVSTIEFQPSGAMLEDAAFVYRADTQDAYYFAIGYDGLPATVTSESDFGQLVHDHDGAAGCVVFAILHRHGLQPARQMRNAMVELAGTLGDIATVYRDEETDVWFYGSKWADELSASLGTGVPSERPAPVYPYRGGGVDEVISDIDGQRYLNIEQFLSVERVPVKVLDEKDLYETKVQLQGDSVLLPLLIDKMHLVIDQSY